MLNNHFRLLVIQIYGTISDTDVNAICFAKFKNGGSLESTTGLVTEVKFIPSSEYYNLKIIPKIKSIKEDEITYEDNFETVQLNVTSDGIVGNLSAFTDFTNPTGYFSCNSYQIYSLTSSEFKDLTTRTNKFKNHINFVNQFVTTQFLANKNGELKHLDSLEININDTQKDLWDNKAGNFKGLRFKFNEGQFRIDSVNGLTLYKNDIAAPKFHEHNMVDIKDWESVSGELYDHFSPKVHSHPVSAHTHYLNDITDWWPVSGRYLSELYSAFFNHLKNHPAAGGGSGGIGGTGSVQFGGMGFPDYSRGFEIRTDRDKNGVPTGPLKRWVAPEDGWLILRTTLYWRCLLYSTSS